MKALKWTQSSTSDVTPGVGECKVSASKKITTLFSGTPFFIVAVADTALHGCPVKIGYV